MENIKPGMLYIAADGDGIGKLVGRAVIANDVDELHSVSSRIDAAQDFILHWCKQIGGIKISGGGDEFTAAIDPEVKDKLKDLRASIEKAFGYTISVGVGRSLSEAGTALLVAKLRGKDRIIYFNKQIKEDIKKAKRRVREGRASQEEYKLSEAYLEKAENMLCDLHKSMEPKTHEEHVVHIGNLQRKVGAAAKKMIGSSKKAMHAQDESGDQAHVNKMNSQHATNVAIHGKLSDQHVQAIKNHISFLQGKLGKSEQYLYSLHKHEEGFHNGAADKEDKGFQNPDAEDNRTDDCSYCQDLDAEENADGTAGMHDCDMCSDYDAKNGTTVGMDDCPACKEYDASQQNTGGIDDCPYCQTENITESQVNPEQERDHICNCPNCPKNDQTDLAVQDMGAEHPDNCPDCQKMYSDAVENEPGQTGQEDPNMQGHETAEEVLDLLDQEPGTGSQSPSEEAKKIDNTELPQGDQMKENVSVKENFGDAQKNDISDSEADMAQSGQESGQSDESGQDSPNFSDILQSGLDDHANDQKKQQVLDMVGQTLAGFKANKASLEATKDQNQALYNSCIQMLKSMIALCDLLGLKPKATETATQDASPVPVQNDAQAGPKAAPSEGAAQDPKTQG